MSEESHFSGRLARYGRVGATMAGLATRVAGEKLLGLEIDKANHAAAITAALGNLKGPVMKVGQILATIPEALPPEYAEALRNLQSNAPAMGPAFVRRRMKQELGENWQAHFKIFDETAAAAASLGQVHKAETPDGLKVACKLQYPDMVSAVDGDLRQLKTLFGLYEQFDKAVKTESIYTELHDRLFEELDYTQEAKNTALFARMLEHTANVHVPQVVQTLCTSRLITTTWCEGQPVLNFKQAPLDVRNTIALNLFQAWYVPLYHYGIIHGDPHMGNYSVAHDLSINLLDFGCIRVFPPRFIHGVVELYRALQTNDEARAVEAYKLWGFENLSRELIDTLTIWARFLYAPVLEDKVRVIGTTENGVYGRDTAREVHQKLKSLGGVHVPREFVFMDRAALGLGSVFIHLQAEVNWCALFNEMIKDFDPKKLQQQQTTLLAQYHATG